MVIFQGRNYKLYRGMDSAGAFRAAGSGRFFGGVLEKTAPEGIEEEFLTRVMFQTCSSSSLAASRQP